MLWDETRDAAEHSTIHGRELPTTKNYLSRNVKNAEVEKPWSLGAKTTKHLII